VTFAWLDIDPDDPMFAPGTSNAFLDRYVTGGVLADRIAWIEPDGEDRLNLN
jgi:hypothetical protein